MMRQPDKSLARQLPSELLARMPYAKGLGIQYIPSAVEAADEPVFWLPYNTAQIGNTKLPALHGGAIAGFMESAALFHLIFKHSDTGRLPKTIDFHIDYVQSAGPRDSYCHCEVAKLGRRVALVQIHCWQQRYDRPVALARAHYLWENQLSETVLTEVLSDK